MLNERLNLLKVFLLVSVLIFSGLMVSISTVADDSAGGKPDLPYAEQTLGTRSAERQATPLVQEDETEPALRAFVGEQNVNFDVILKSLYEDDYDDTHGDNVLYDIEIYGTDANAQVGNLQWYDATARQFVNVNQPVFNWVTKVIVPDSNDKNDDFLYNQSDPAIGGAWKYIFNMDNTYVDEDNDGTIDADEYWAIQTGNKSFGDFEVNILGTAKPGYYRMKFQVVYRYQVSAPINASGIGNGSSAVLPGTSDDLFTENEALGHFDYYYWVPWNASDGPNGALPKDDPPGTANSDGLADVYNNNTANFDFRKRLNYIAPSNQYYHNIWEALPDNGKAKPSQHPDLDGDGYNSWLPTYPGNLYNGMDALFQPILNNYPTPPDIDQQGNNVDAGNGTWQYTGNTGDIDWGQDPHTDDVWVDFIIRSTIQPDEDLNEDNLTNDIKLVAKDDDYYTGSVFEEFYLELTNMDSIEMRDVEAQLILPTLEKGGLEHYGGFDTAKINSIDTSDTEDLPFRISIDKDTPPGYYYGSLILKYTKRYGTGQFDPLGNELTTDITVTEDHWIVQIMIDYTPDLGDAKVKIAPSLQIRGRPTTQIDVSTGKQIFEFDIKNTGNVDLYGGNKTDGNLQLEFAEFTQMGQGYYDSDADPGINLTPINIGMIPVGERIKKTVPVQIPYHWYLPEGVYRLYMNFSGYYYNDGALGDPTGFIYMQLDWEGLNDDGTNRTCYVKIDKTGNERVNDAGDTKRITEGIYTEIYINKFDPKTKELSIINWTPKELNQEKMKGGAYDFSITFKNNQDFIMYNIWVEVDIEGYFDESYYYDWTNPSPRENPKFFIDMLDPNDQLTNNGTWMVNFTIDDVDKLLPEGEHHIPIKYSYDFDEYQGVEEMSTFSIIWDTGSVPFEPYIDANANFMLNKGVGITRGAGAVDIVFVVDGTSYNSMGTYRTYLRDAIDSFASDLNTQGINYEFAVVGFNQDSWVAQDLTTDTNKIELAIDSMPNSGSCGVYDAVIEALRNNFIGQKISYRKGATKVIILHTNYRPNEGTTDENIFALACKGECIFFAIADTGYWYYYDLTALNTGGQLFNSYAGSSNYPLFLNTITYTLTGVSMGITPTGKAVYDVKLKDVMDLTMPGAETYGPYIVVNVRDTARDIDTRVISSPISLGGRIRNINMQVQLTNREYVQYTDVEVKLPLFAQDGTNLFINPNGSAMSIKGQVSSRTLGPNGASITVTFNLDLNTAIGSGVYEVDLEFNAMNDYTKQIVKGSVPVQIRIYPRQPILTIQQTLDRNGNPSGKAEVSGKAKPGEEFTLSFTLTNVGDDAARDIYVSISSDWYMDSPFSTIGALIDAIYSNSSTTIIDSNVGSLPEKMDISLSDLGISSTSDIIDAERQLLSPTAVVPRFYIREIPAGGSYVVKFKLKADTHMVQGRPYKEWILLEYVDSDGLHYSYDESNPQLSTKPIPIIIYTEKDDLWPREEGITSETLAVILIIIIIIIIILLFLGSVYNKRRMKEEGFEEEEEEAFGEEEEEEELEEEEMPEEEEELEEDLPEDMKEEEKKEDWDIDEEPHEEEKEEEEEDDWDIEVDTEEEKKVPAKGKAPVIRPGKAPQEKDEIDNW